MLARALNLLGVDQAIMVREGTAVETSPEDALTGHAARPAYLIYLAGANN
jgi:hypothetical protein